jgi:hypothetical protein
MKKTGDAIGDFDGVRDHIHILITL